jgi:hypothetical protein
MEAHIHHQTREKKTQKTNKYKYMNARALPTRSASHAVTLNYGRPRGIRRFFFFSWWWPRESFSRDHRGTPPPPPLPPIIERKSEQKMFSIFFLFFNGLLLFPDIIYLFI